MKKLLMLLLLMPVLLIHICTLSAENSKRYSNKLYLNKKLSVTPYISDKNGNRWPENTELKKNKNIFISFIPDGRWKLKEKHQKKYFDNILIQQEDSTIFPVRITSNKIDNKIVSLTMEIVIDVVTFYEPITLSIGEQQSCELSIPEQNWPGYLGLLNHKNTGFSMFNSRRYLHSLEEFNYLFQPEPLIQHLSFYGDVIRKYGKSIQFYLSSCKHKVDFIEMSSMQSVNKEMLIKIATFSDSLQTLSDISKTYLSIISVSEADRITENIKQQISDVSRIQSEIENLYGRKQMYFFMNNDFTIYQFHLYLNILAKLLIEREHISDISKIKAIDIELIDNIPGAKDELISLDWFYDFCEKVKVLNKNIENKGYIFHENILVHFDSLKESEPEPYSQIFRAFNLLAKDNINGFIGNLIMSLEKSTELHNIFSMEMWILSYNASINYVPTETLNQINTGLEYLKHKDFAAAENEFDIVRKKASTFAPANYYYGLIKHNNLERIKASIFFERALLGYPAYIAPRIFRLDNYIYNRDFTAALNEVNIAISVNKYWIYYFYKAKILYYLNRYNEATDICMNHCMVLNENNFDLMILLGDIYYRTSDLSRAKSYYHRAGSIKPEDPIFTERMTTINKQSPSNE